MDEHSAPFPFESLGGLFSHIELEQCARGPLRTEAWQLEGWIGV